jgi:predicted O-methyltransferase YrrM
MEETSMTNTEYQFTKDWFNWAPEVWQQLIPHLPGEPGKRRFLEIGSFEGRSTVWIMENMMADGDYMLCIDTWQGGEEHGEEDMDAVFNRFRANVQAAREKTGIKSVGHSRETSTKGLAEELIEWAGTYDFIYIDGSHIAKDVLTDACMAWPLLKPKGLMVFDDYMWGNPRDILHRPKPAIDAFCNLFAEEADIVHVGYQLIVRKKG